MTDSKQIKQERILDFDDIKGDDLFFYSSKKTELVLRSTNSPLDNRILELFKFTYKVSEIKPFKAVWMIDDKELQIMFVNGIIKNKKLTTYDFIPEHPGEDLRFNFKFTGNIICTVERITKLDEALKLIENQKINVVFKNGILKSLNK